MSRRRVALVLLLAAFVLAAFAMRGVSMDEALAVLDRLHGGATR